MLVPDINRTYGSPSRARQTGLSMTTEPMKEAAEQAAADNEQSPLAGELEAVQTELA